MIERRGNLFEVSSAQLRKNGARELGPVSFAMAPGERLIVLGEAGAGQDALLRVLGGFGDEGDEISGTIRFAGHPEQELGKRYRPPIRIGYLPNPLKAPLAGHSSLAKQLVRVVAAKMKAPLGSAREELRLALERLPGDVTLALLNTRPEQLDLVTQALALLAAVTAQTPDLVLADRPMADLGPKATRLLLEALDREQQRLGFALLYATGGLQASARLGGRVLVLKSGKVVEEGDADRLMQGQSHPYTARFFESLPVLRDEEPKPRPTAMRGQPLVQVHNLAFGGEASPRDGLTFELRRGASLALTGEPGSGRRKLLRLMLGFDPAPPGRVLFDAVDLNVLSPAMAARIRRRIAIISGKDDVLDPRMTLWDTVEEPLRAHLSLSGDLVAAYRDAALKRVGLASHDGTRAVASLPVFDKRRLQVARAIVGAPLLVVVDEPQLGLDALAQSILREVLADFRASQGPAFLVLTSDLTIAQALAEEAMVFEKGKLVERGLLAQLLRHPKAAATKALIEAVSLPGLSLGMGSV